MLFKKILVATDFSKPAEKLYDCIAGFKGLGLEEVHVLHVIPLHHLSELPYFTVENFPEGLDITNPNADKVAPALVNTAEKLDSIKRYLEGYKVKVTTHITVGYPATEINNLARKEEVSLIVVGSRGRGYLREAFLGSTSSDLIRTSALPVLVEKYKSLLKDEEPVLTCQDKFNRVLLPFDFSENAEEVLNKFKEMKDLIGEIILLTVLDKGETVQDLEIFERNYIGRLEAMTGEFKREGFLVKTILKSGIPSQEILITSEEENVTMIAMATRGEGFIKGLLLGSTTEAVTRRSKRPVMVFPNKE